MGLFTKHPKSPTSPAPPASPSAAESALARLHVTEPASSFLEKQCDKAMGKLAGTFQHTYTIVNRTNFKVNVSLHAASLILSHAALSPCSTFTDRITTPPGLSVSIVLRPHTGRKSEYTARDQAVRGALLGGAILGGCAVVVAGAVVAVPAMAAAGAGGSASVAAGSAFSTLSSSVGAAVTSASAASGSLSSMAMAAGSSLSASSSAATLGTASMKGLSLVSKYKALASKAKFLPVVGGLKASLEKKVSQEWKDGKERAREFVGAAIRGDESESEDEGDEVTYEEYWRCAGGGPYNQELRAREKELSKRGGRPFLTVDITGVELGKVVQCRTGRKELDRTLKEAWKSLEAQDKTFEPKDDPVVVIRGGPAIERGAQYNHQILLVFYPYFFERDEGGAVVTLQILDEEESAHFSEGSSRWDEHDSVGLTASSELAMKREEGQWTRHI